MQNLEVARPQRRTDGAGRGTETPGRSVLYKVKAEELQSTLTIRCRCPTREETIGVGLQVVYPACYIRIHSSG